MPIIEIHLLEGRTVEQKRRLHAAVTQAAVDTVGARPEQVRIMITEHGGEHFSIAGQTANQRKAAAAAAEEQQK